MDAAKFFATLDINLAAFLSLLGVRPALEERNGKVIFTFEATDELYRLMNRYNSNEPVPVADFVTAAKTLRAKMLALKESITGNGKGYGNGNRKDF